MMIMMMMMMIIIIVIIFIIIHNFAAVFTTANFVIKCCVRYVLYLRKPPRCEMFNRRPKD
jgi:hypothetical protein